jgi:hypothetical protein
VQKKYFLDSKLTIDGPQQPRQKSDNRALDAQRAVRSRSFFDDYVASINTIEIKQKTSVLHAKLMELPSICPFVVLLL